MSLVGCCCQERSIKPATSVPFSVEHVQLYKAGTGYSCLSGANGVNYGQLEHKEFSNLVRMVLFSLPKAQSVTGCE